MDFENQSTYSVRVRTTDSGGAIFEQPVLLSIQNVPEIVGTPIVGDGTAQRSMVKKLTIKFDSAIEFEAGAFEVNKRGASGGSVDVLTQTEFDSNGHTIVSLLFSGPLTRNGALQDGNYELLVHGASISGWVGGDFRFGNRNTDQFYAYFGDTNGDRTVGVAEFNQFRSSFGKSSNDVGYNGLFDFDGIVGGVGLVGVFDFNQFRSRFGRNLGFE